MINQAFRDMISELLPSQSEQDNFFNSFQQPLKKSLSINRHRAPDFEKKNPDFLLGKGPFHEFPDTQYIDREDTSTPLGKTRQHLTGQFYIQEVAAALPANILKSYLTPTPLLSERGSTSMPISSKNDTLWSSLSARRGNEGEVSQPIKILDVCAAPG
jgi:N-terminal domain of 16S rRNA methyltransferase RsmF